ncbi:hypothetical protein [Hahella sp. NBU794]
MKSTGEPALPDGKQPRGLLLQAHDIPGVEHRETRYDDDARR